MVVSRMIAKGVAKAIATRGAAAAATAEKTAKAAKAAAAPLKTHTATSAQTNAAYQTGRSAERAKAVSDGYASGRVEKTRAAIKGIRHERRMKTVKTAAATAAVAAGGVALGAHSNAKAATPAKSGGADRTKAYTDSKGRHYANGRKITRKSSR